MFWSLLKLRSPLHIALGTMNQIRKYLHQHVVCDSLLLRLEDRYESLDILVYNRGTFEAASRTVSHSTRNSQDIPTAMSTTLFQLILGENQRAHINARYLASIIHGGDFWWAKPFAVERRSSSQVRNNWTLTIVYRISHEKNRRLKLQSRHIIPRTWLWKVTWAREGLYLEVHCAYCTCTMKGDESKYKQN